MRATANKTKQTKQPFAAVSHKDTPTPRSTARSRSSVSELTSTFERKNSAPNMSRPSNEEDNLASNSPQLKQSSRRSSRSRSNDLRESNKMDTKGAALLDDSAEHVPEHEPRKDDQVELHDTDVTSAQLLIALKQMSKDIRGEVASIKEESKQSMDSLEIGIRNLTLSQATMGNTIGTMRADQGELSKTVAEVQSRLDTMQIELEETKKVVADHKRDTGASVDVIAENIRCATEKVKLEEDLQAAINVARNNVITIGWKPQNTVSNLDGAKEFLKVILGKSDTEIENLGLVNASYTKTDTNHPVGVLTFNSDTSVGLVLSDKRKAREKNIKVKADVPLAYKDVDKQWKHKAYLRFMKGYVSRFEFEGTTYVYKYKMKDNGANQEYYQWTVDSRFKPESLRVAGGGLEADKRPTPVDVLDTVLIEYKDPKTSIETLESEIQTMLSEHYVELGITESCIKAVSKKSVLIRSTVERVNRVKAIADGKMPANQSATTNII